jgi:hypothetical protein
MGLPPSSLAVYSIYSPILAARVLDSGVKRSLHGANNPCIYSAKDKNVLNCITAVFVY